MMGGKPGSHFTTDGSSPTLTRGRGSVNDVHAIALDGDKLKPREDQRKGGNGFGVNEDGAGYTLTGVDRHGVAYGINNQGGAAPQFTDETSGTMVAASNSSGNNLHGVAYENDHLNRCEVARSLNGDHDDRVTDSGTSVVHVGMAQNTRDEVRIVGDGEIVGALPAEPGMKQQTYVVSTNSNGLITKGSGEAILSDEHHMALQCGGGQCGQGTPACVISTNSNGGDVAPTLTQDLAKQTGAQQANGGGYVVTRQEGATNE